MVIDRTYFKRYRKSIEVYSCKDISIGDTITILKKPRTWSSYCGGDEGRDKVTYPYITKIMNIKYGLAHHAILDENNYGWTLETIIKEGCLLNKEGYYFYK